MIYLSIYLSIYPSIHQSINQSINQSIYLSIYLSIYYTEGETGQIGREAEGGREQTSRMMILDAQRTTRWTAVPCHACKANSLVWKRTEKFDAAARWTTGSWNSTTISELSPWDYEYTYSLKAMERERGRERERDYVFVDMQHVNADRYPSISQAVVTNLANNEREYLDVASMVEVHPIQGWGWKLWGAAAWSSSQHSSPHFWLQEWTYPPNQALYFKIRT